MQTLRKATQQGDVILQLVVAALLFFGVAMVFSAGSYQATDSDGNYTPAHYLIWGGAWALVGALVMLASTRLSMSFWWRMARLMLACSIILLLLLLVPGIGSDTNNAVRWIAIGPVSIMPGEIAKPCVIVFVSWFLCDKSKRAESLEGTGMALLLCAVFGVLIMLQPNMSTAIIICLLIFAIFFVAGMKPSHLAACGVIVLLLSAAVILVKGTERLSRMLAMMDPFGDAMDEGYQIVQVLVALGTGGLFGVGPGKSVAKTSYLPEPMTDSILAVIGEELGMVGIMFLMALYMILMWRCVRICMYAPDRFSMLVGSGITAMLCIHVILNIAINTNTMIYTGVTLPFISYGGNSMLVFCWGMGVMLHISQHTIVPDGRAGSGDRPFEKERFKLHRRHKDKEKGNESTDHGRRNRGTHIPRTGNR